MAAPFEHHNPATGKTYTPKPHGPVGPPAPDVPVAQVAKDQAISAIPDQTWIPVQSSNLAWIWYDYANQNLRVKFHSGSVYGYAMVPVSVVRGLFAAYSKGSYFHHHIRTKYPYGRF